MQEEIRSNSQSMKFIEWDRKLNLIFTKEKKFITESNLCHKNGPSQVEVQTQIDFWSDSVERTPVCSQTEITGSFRKFERITVWSWFGDGLIRGHFGLKSLIIGGFERTFVWSEATSSAIGSDHKCLQTQLGLIRDHFERIIFFHCFRFFYWKMLALPRGSQKAAFWSETHLKSDSSDQKKRVQQIAEAGPL